jgi:glycosyltransferase involved in cell wall biosynthesis
LAYFFPPLGGGGVQRTSKFVKYLPSSGWTPVVVTVKEGAYWVADRSLSGDVPPDVEVVRTKSLSPFGVLRWIPGGGRRARADTDPCSEPAGRGGARLPAAAVERSGERSGGLFRFLRGLSSFFLIPDQYVGWVPFAARAAARRIGRGDISVVYTTSSPDSAHLAGLLVKRSTGKPWVADFRDPWTERLTFNAPTRLHLGLQRRLERTVLANADRIVCTSEDIVSDFRRKYPLMAPHKFAVVTNGFDPEDFQGVAVRSSDARGGSAGAGGGAGSAAGSTPGRADTAAGAMGAERVTATPWAESRPGAKFSVTHTGILTGKRNSFGFLEGLKLFLERRPGARPKMDVLFVGTRDRENEARARELGLDGVVRFEDTLPHLECVRLQSASDLLLLIEHDSYRGSLIYPAKLYEYAASGRPVLALLPEGAASRLVRSLDAGVVVPPSDAEKVASALELYFSHHESGMPLGGVSDRSLLAPFERPALAKRLASVLDGVAGA